jgi:hypothetical protein
MQFMGNKRLSRGLLQVYTGDGKGKTTCALGLALRALGQGFKVYVGQFLKGRETGEFKAAVRFAPELTWRYFGRPGLVNLKSPAPLTLRDWGWGFGGGGKGLPTLSPLPQLTSAAPASPRPRPGSGSRPRR